MFNLGVIFAEAKGVAEDDAAGFKWMKAAAERGDPPAALRLAMMYRDGEGVGRDSIEAYYWSSVAAETLGVEMQEKAAAMRFELGEALSKQAREEADERIAEWRESRRRARGAEPPSSEPNARGEAR
jgi:TPR repeat protein